MDRARRARRCARAKAEAKIIAGFALLAGSVLFIGAETLRVFLRFDDEPMLWPAGWACLVIGYWLGRSGMRHEMTRDYP